MNINILETLKILVFASVLFVWVVRYDNIIEEFKVFGYPSWMRDLVGILKISFVIMLMNKNSDLINLGCMGIILLMICALVTHFRMKNPLPKMLPSLTLLFLSIVIFSQTY